MTEQERIGTSRFLSLVLRHRPETIGLQLDEAGWASVDELLAGCRAHGRPITPEQLAEVVATNDKQRFSFSADGTRIRANQGHSVSVELGYEPAEPPEVLYHGTGEKYVASIRAQGLLRRKRHHVHLSRDRETAVKVGQRHGRPVVIEVLAGRMHRDGVAFFLSENGVWLTEHVPVGYLVFPE